MALVRFQFPDQEPRQCRLAGAVRTDYADAVAPLHAKGEILQDRAVAEALRYILRIDDDLGLALAAFGRQPGDAGRALHGTANLAHFLQLAEPPLVAPAPRGDAALKPVKRLRQFGVEPLRVSRLFLLDLFRPCLETADTRSDEHTSELQS